MRMCEALFGKVRDADRVQEMVEAATGEPCPCAQGMTCPLFGKRLAELAASA